MRDFGYRAEKTWRAISGVIDLLANGAANALETILAKGPGAEAAKEASRILSEALVEERARDRKRRIKAWKGRLQDSERKAYEWMRSSGSTQDRKSTRLNSSHSQQSRMPSSA